MKVRGDKVTTNEDKISKDGNGWSLGAIKMKMPRWSFEVLFELNFSMKLEVKEDEVATNRDIIAEDW